MSVPNTFPLVPHVVVHLGVRFHRAYPGMCQMHTILVTTPPEFALDDVFSALNRVDETAEDDCRRLPYEWQRTARRRLDLMHAPSMSVGDTLQMFSARGHLLGSFEVGEQGWAVLDA